MAERKFVDQVCQVMIWFVLKATPIAIDTLLKISDGLLSFGLFKAFITDEEIGAAGLVIVLFHH
jgi:hypothetical protein